LNRRYSALTLITVAFACISAAVLGTFGVFLYRFGGQSELNAALKYSEIKQIISEYYIGDYHPLDVDAAAYRAAIESLDDDWSYYMTAEQHEYYNQYSDNRYAGIGVTISAHEETGGLLITNVAADSPAELAGIQIGDIMIAVDGESIFGMTVGEVKAIIQPKLGGELSLTLQDSAGEQRTLLLNCELVYQNPVKYELLEHNIGYISIENFENGSGSGAVSAVDALISQGAVSLIFDVRSNPGGKVTQLLEILDYLLPEGDLFITKSKEGEEKVEVSDADFIDLPIAVLVDADSYSAAEFFAAALSDYEWATVVGQRTTGKGRSQVTFTLSDGSAVHISNNVYLTPNRIDLSEQGGLVPDIEVSADDTGDDSQLQAAIACLR